MNIRLFAPQDTEQIARLFHETVREVNQPDYTINQVKAWAPHDLHFHDWLQFCSQNLTYIAEEQGIILGFAQLEYNGYIDCFYCHKHCQRRGIGTQIYASIEAKACQLGIERLYTEASITAKPFFLKMGFSLLHKQSVQCRGETFINYAMEKVLRKCRV